MATGGQKEVGCSLVSVGALTLENSDRHPYYTGIVVSRDMIIVVDFNACKVQLYRLQDGKLLATHQLESRPSDICLINDTEICVILWNGPIEIMSVDSTDKTGTITTIRTLHVKGGLEVFHGVVTFKSNLAVCGVDQDTMCWCIVSLNDGHVETIHQICKGDLWSYLTIKENMIYISCYAGVDSTDNGVYGYDILNPSQHKYRYEHKDLNSPRGITINKHGFIFVCNYEYPYCIHRLTDTCQFVSIYRQGIPRYLRAIFWDQHHGHLYVTCRGSNVITRYRSEYPGDYKASEVLMSDERKQPVIEETSTQIGQGIVDKGQSSVETETPPSVQVPEDSDNDKQGHIIPVEILRMDDKSVQLYKKALRDGTEKVFNIRVMVVGQYGVGKTTLTKRLLGQLVDISERKSTEGIDVYKHCCNISLDSGEWIVQLENADQLSRLQRLMKLLYGPDQKPDVSQEQEGHNEVIYQRETSEVDTTNTNDTSASSGPDQEVKLTSLPAELSIIKVDGVAHSDQKTSNVAIAKSEAESSESGKKKDAVMEILHLINEYADKLEKVILKYAAVSIWDFAGQYAFYTTHQTFLTSRAIYLLVIDLNQQVTDLIEDDKCFLDMEGIKVCKVHDLIEIWLNSIHSCAPSPEGSIPNVILVGTHVDKLSEKSRKEVIDKYFKKLRYLLKEKPTIRHLMDDVAIDNTQCDPMLEELKRRIFELASQQPHWGEEKPARWLPLEQAIMTLKASGAKVVALSLIQEINRSGSVRIEDRDELDLFLKFHHEMGTILYFSIEGLREKIVLDPQWFIDALKSLITAETFIKKYPAITNKWYEFEETGKLTHELIDTIWTQKENQEFHDNKDHILLLMEKLNIIAKPRSFTEEGKEVKEADYYLAPCMLHQAAPKEIISPESDPEMENTSVLCFVCTGHFLPPPVFHRLLGACLTHWPIAKQRSKNLIYCGCCVLDLDPLHRLTLHFRDYVIFARITIMGVTDMSLSSKLCSEARNFIFENLSKIIGNLGKSLQFEPHVQCPDSDADSLEGLVAVSLLQKNEKVACHSHDKSHILKSRELLKFWFKDEEQSGDGDASRENKTNKKAKHKISESSSTNKRKRKGKSALKGTVAKKKANTNQSDRPDKTGIADVEQTKKTASASPVLVLASSPMPAPISSTKPDSTVIPHSAPAFGTMPVPTCGQQPSPTVIPTPAPTSCSTPATTVVSMPTTTFSFTPDPTSGPIPAIIDYTMPAPTAVSTLASTADPTPALTSISTPTTTVGPMSASSSGFTPAPATCPMPAPTVDDTDRFMHIACLLVNVGSKVLRRLLHYHTVTPACTLDQYLAYNSIYIGNLQRRQVLTKSQIDILFPQGGSTNLGDYDITLLSTLFINIVPSISQQEENMIQTLREDRNKIFAHAKSVMMNQNDYQKYWNDICKTLMALCKQIGDPDFENEISKEIQDIQVSTIQGTSSIDTLRTQSSRIETLERLVQALMSSVHALESKKQSDES